PYGGFAITRRGTPRPYRGFRRYRARQASPLLLFAVGRAHDGEHVLLADDQVLDVLQLELVAGVLRVEHSIADLELHRDLGPVVENSTRPDRLYQALLGLLLGGVGQDDPALGLLLSLDRLQHHPVAQGPKVHAFPSEFRNLLALTCSECLALCSTEC